MTNKVWKTKDGREIPVNEMTKVHLINSWRFFTKKHTEILTRLESYTQYPNDLVRLKKIEARLKLLLPEMIERGLHED